LNIHDDNILENVDEATEKSLNGPRVTHLIKKVSVFLSKIYIFINFFQFSLVGSRLSQFPNCCEMRSKMGKVKGAVWEQNGIFGGCER